MAPWATPEMAEERAQRLEATLTQARAAGGCDEVVKSLEAELQAQQKRAVDEPSALTQVEDTSGFVERARKRLAKIGEEMEQLRKRETAARTELQEAETRLEMMKAKAASQLNLPPPENSGQTNLEDAVRALLVALH